MRLLVVLVVDGTGGDFSSFAAASLLEATLFARLLAVDLLAIVSVGSASGLAFLLRVLAFVSAGSIGFVCVRSW